MNFADFNSTKLDGSLIPKILSAVLFAVNDAYESVWHRVAVLVLFTAVIPVSSPGLIVGGDLSTCKNMYNDYGG